MSSATVTPAPRPPRRLEAPTPRVALVIGAVVVLGVVLYMGRSALTPFIAGALLIYILDPAVNFFSRLRVAGRTLPRWLAVLVVYAITFFIVVEAVALLLVPLINQLLQFVTDFPRLLAALDEALARLREIYGSLEMPEALREYLDDLLAGLANSAPSIDLGALLPLARIIAGTVAGLFGFIIIPVWGFYILRDRVRLTEQLKSALPPAWRRDVLAVLHIIDRVVGRWIRAQIVLGLIVGAATYAGLLLLGNLIDPRFIQFALLLAVIAGVLELLPIIGPIISMVPTLLIGLTTADPVPAVIGVVVLYTAVQQVENAILVPKIQGDAVELHPSLIIFALIVGAAIAGLPGAILSIPITAAARNVFRYLFRRLSEDDPSVPSADAPDMVALTGEEQPANEERAPEVDMTNDDPPATEGPVPPAGAVDQHEQSNARPSDEPVSGTDAGRERRP
jgi:predicted PurR-regulated permease PerM